MICDDCNGTGRVPIPRGVKTCSGCGGSGKIKAPGDFIRRPVVEGLECIEQFCEDEGCLHSDIIHHCHAPNASIGEVESNLTGCLDPEAHQGRCGYSKRHVRGDGTPFQPIDWPRL